MDHFVVAYVFCVSLLLLLWTLPINIGSRIPLVQNFRGFITWSGLDTYWALFAPVPLSKNYRIGFEIVGVDNSVEPLKLPEYSVRHDYQYVKYSRYIRMHNFLLNQPDETPKKSICKFILNRYRRDSNKTNAKAVRILMYFESNNPNLKEVNWMSKTVYTYHVDDN